MSMIDRVFLLSHPRYHVKNINFIINTFRLNDYLLDFIFNTFNLRLKTLFNKRTNTPVNEVNNNNIDNINWFTIIFSEHL